MNELAVTTYRLEWVQYQELHSGAPEKIEKALENGEFGETLDHSAGYTNPSNNRSLDWTNCDAFYTEHGQKVYQSEPTYKRVALYNSDNYDSLPEAYTDGAVTIVKVPQNLTITEVMRLAGAVAGGVLGVAYPFNDTIRAVTLPDGFRAVV